ncbi:hypothetical protein [Streptomyces lushanensis]|uniref:hypothetical protein n=1 Tax=Streptomyces lushanensis TaxID=1434255 RepID=UPI00082E1D2F|nr:hypothetical protein [Streptomyces lushanensis]
MFQPGTTVQYTAPCEHWGAYASVAAELGDGETYTVDLLPPRSGTAVCGHSSVVRVWDAPAEDVLPAVRPGGTLPIPGCVPCSGSGTRRFPRRVSAPPPRGRS